MFEPKFEKCARNRKRLPYFDSLVIQLFHTSSYSPLCICPRPTFFGNEPDTGEVQRLKNSDAYTREARSSIGRRLNFFEKIRAFLTWRERSTAASRLHTAQREISSIYSSLYAHKITKSERHGPSVPGLIASRPRIFGSKLKKYRS